MTALRAAKRAVASETDAQLSNLYVLRTVVDVRKRVRAARRSGLTIALVPTMGALHDGHLSLIRAARRRCDLVVVSLFVNPTQFDEQSDLATYPRAEARDATLAQRAGADVLFAPSAAEIYRPGFATTVQVHGLTDRFEGAVRGEKHFIGVTTVVCKLLNIVAPDLAFFGQKDAQQAAVIRRMVADLHIDVQIETMPTVREPDSLAMSSRNARLTPSQRRQALALHAALQAAERLVARGERSSQRLLEAAGQVLADQEISPDYIALVDHVDFHELQSLQDEGLMLIAARIGQTRLIDNLLLHAPVSGDAQREPIKRANGRRKET